MLDEKQKKIEKILKDLANLQVRACVLSSQTLKQPQLQTDTFAEAEEDVAVQVEQIGAEFTEVTRKLVKKLQSPAIEKTLSKLESASFYNPGLAQFYLTQLIHEMKSVAEHTKSALNINKIEAQYKKQLEEKKLESEAKKIKVFETETPNHLTKETQEALVYQIA